MTPQEILDDVIQGYSRTGDALADGDMRIRCVNHIMLELRIDDYEIVRVSK